MKFLLHNTAFIIATLFCSTTLFAQTGTDSLRANEATPILHEVEKGQNLFRVSYKYNVKLNFIRKWNKIVGDEIVEGQKLIVGFECGELDPNFPIDRNTTIVHHVAKGENLFQVSVKYNVTLNFLRKWNRLENDLLVEGQELIVGFHCEGEKSPAAEREIVEIILASAETFSKIHVQDNQVKNRYNNSEFPMLYFPRLESDSKNRRKMFVLIGGVGTALVGSAILIATTGDDSSGPGIPLPPDRPSGFN